MKKIILTSFEQIMRDSKKKLEISKIEKTIFNYLKKNLTLQVELEEISSNYESPGFTTVKANLFLVNPETGKPEQI